MEAYQLHQVATPKISFYSTAKPCPNGTYTTEVCDLFMIFFSCVVMLIILHGIYELNHRCGDSCCTGTPTTSACRHPLGVGQTEQGQCNNPVSAVHRLVGDTFYVLHSVVL